MSTAYGVSLAPKKVTALDHLAMSAAFAGILFAIVSFVLVQVLKAKPPGWALNDDKTLNKSKFAGRIIGIALGVFVAATAVIWVVMMRSSKKSP